MDSGTLSCGVLVEGAVEMTTLSADQILALAPDPKSAKAGKGLATGRKWVSLGQSDQAVWGECQGSGSEPYRTQIDLNGLGFRCTCPSRKLPCKHSLGLFLLFESAPTTFAQSEPPEWVVTWLRGRAARVKQRENREGRNGEVADPAAQSKRVVEREARVTAGLEGCEQWLHDLVRQGLASVPGRPYSFWDAPAAQLVDAQAPEMARWIRELGGISSSGEGWQQRLLAELGRVALLLEGWQRRALLSSELQAELRTLIGWGQSQDEALGGNGATVRDRWHVVGQRVTTVEQLRVQHTWLWGHATNRAALVLDFAPQGRPLDLSLVAGTTLDADLSFYPGVVPMRALISKRHDSPVPSAEMAAGYPTIAVAIGAWSGILAQNPWLERFPCLLEAVVPCPLGATPRPYHRHWVVQDGGHRLPLKIEYNEGWRLMTLSGGHPLTLFGEWDGQVLRPLSCWSVGRFHPLAWVG